MTKICGTIPINAERFIERLSELRDMAISPYMVGYEGKAVKYLKKSVSRAVKVGNLPYPLEYRC